MNYRLLIDYEVIEFMEKLPRKDQRQLRDRLVSLQKFPSRFSDYVESDSEDRLVDIHICGTYVIKFWQDYADRHVKILDLHSADRPGESST